MSRFLVLVNNTATIAVIFGFIEPRRACYLLTRYVFVDYTSETNQCCVFPVKRILLIVSFFLAGGKHAIRKTAYLQHNNWCGSTVYVVTKIYIPANLFGAVVRSIRCVFRTENRSTNYRLNITPKRNIDSQSEARSSSRATDVVEH